jgi:hypothetical protein
MWGTRWQEWDGLIGAMTVPSLNARLPAAGVREPKQDSGGDPRRGSTRPRPADAGAVREVVDF